MHILGLYRVSLHNRMPAVQKNPKREISAVVLCYSFPVVKCRFIYVHSCAFAGYDSRLDGGIKLCTVQSAGSHLRAHSSACQHSSKQGCSCCSAHQRCTCVQPKPSLLYSGTRSFLVQARQNIASLVLPLHHTLNTKSLAWINT